MNDIVSNYLLFQSPFVNNHVSCFFSGLFVSQKFIIVVIVGVEFI